MRNPDDTPRPRPRPRRGRLVLFGLVLAVVALGLALAAGEGGLRLYFWGGAQRTLGAPGPGYFETLMRKGNFRATIATWPKEGATRILIQGDSISWGLGVRDWRDIYPNLLIERLNHDGGKYDLALLAEPGREMDGHLDVLRHLENGIDPDILVYQWYVNDIEVGGTTRPDNTRVWQRWRWHDRLKASSYLYYFLDWRLSTLLKPPARSYTQYLLDDYKEGGQPWSNFLATFHSWAVNAAAAAPRRIVMLYPTVPLTDPYSLQSFNDRMKALARPHTYTIPVWTLHRKTGNSADDADSTFGDVRRLRPGEAGGWLFYGPGIAMAKGAHHANIRVRLDEAHPGHLGRLDVATSQGQRVLAQRDLDGTQLTPGKWQALDLDFTVEEPLVQDLEFRFLAEPGAPVSFDTIAFDVDYGLEIVDPIDQLRGFDTRASIFDAHPNERAHQVLADVLFKAIVSKGR